MKPTTRVALFGLMLGAGGAWAHGAHAQDAPAPVAAEPTAAPSGVEGWQAVDEATLATTRGGFDLPSGLTVAFGIDRAVYVNGTLVTQTSFNIPDVAHITPTQAAVMAAANNTTVVQVGQGNSVDPSILNQGVGATVIQNSLNGQHLQSMTTINATVNSLNAFRSLNQFDGLQSALQTMGH